MIPWLAIPIAVLGFLGLVMVWRWRTRTVRAKRQARKALRRSNEKWMRKQQEYLSEQRRTH